MTCAQALLADVAETAHRPLDAGLSLPPGCYTDAGFHALEVERVFAREWICLGRADQMAAPGDYLTLDLPGLAPVMAVRQKDGSIRALSRVCRHRAALLGEPGGGHANLFVCPYHNWVYELDGALRGAPAMDGHAAFDRADCALPQYRAEVWEGFVFVNLDPGAEPLAPRLADVSVRIAAHRISALKSAFTVQEAWETNWKVAVENGSESYHHIGVHKATLDPFFPGLGTACEPGAAGYNLHAVPTHEAFALPAVAGGGGLPPQAYRELLIVGIYPTLVLAFTGDMVTWFTFNPLGPHNTQVRTGNLVPEAYLAAPDAAERLASDRLQLEVIVAEDRESCTGVQRGLSSPDAVQGPLSPLERPIAEFIRYLAGRLAA